MYDIEKVIQRLEQILGHPLEELTFQPGDLMIQKDQHTPIYLILQGRCKVYINDSRGGEIPLGSFGAGVTLGDMSNVSQTVASANVVAETAMKVNLVPREAFLSLWDKSPEISRDLYRHMCDRLQSTNTHLATKVNKLIDLKMDLQQKVDSQVSDLRIKNDELEEQHRELNSIMKERDRFLNMAIHDMRSPLSIIQGYIGLLQAEGGAGVDRDKVLEIIDKNCSNMLALIGDMLGVATVHSSSLQLDLHREDPTPIIASVVDGQRILAKNKGITIEFTPPATPLPLNIDHRRFREILDNLVSNAIKFSNGGTTITVSVEKLDENKGIRFSVRDQGLGIPEEHLDHVFRSFQKIGNEPTAGETSTGLGLSIVKRLVDLHDGEVAVESRVGEGSSFSFTLPL